MGILIFTARVHDLMYQKHEIEYKMTRITKQIRDLQQYSAIIGNGSISIGDMLRAPASMAGRTVNYLGYAHNSAMQYMQANAPMMQQMYAQQMQNMQNPQQATMMQNYIMRSLYAQGRDRAAQVEMRNLKELEERLAQEKEEQETLLAEVNEEIKAAKQARDQDIKDFAPKYTASA